MRMTNRWNTPVQLRHDFYIEGFNTENDLNYVYHYFTFEVDIVFAGKTSEIPDDVIKLVAHKGDLCEFYWNEKLDDYDKAITARESVESACNKPYCLITKYL